MGREGGQIGGRGGGGRRQVVDWALAERSAIRWAPPGPAVGLAEARDAVAELAAGAAAATAHVSRVTGLVVPAGSPVRVVDRAGWVRANTASLRALLEPVLADALDRRDERTRSRAADRPAVLRRLGLGGGSDAGAGPSDGPSDGPGGALALAVGGAVTGTELGALLAWLSSRVLGQYDAFGTEGGQLLLVAPNVVHVERELGVDPGDFRLWVALHEETHRVQFAVAPWLAGHLADRARMLSGELLGGDDAGGAQRLLAVARGLRGAATSADGVSAGLLEHLGGPEQRRALAEVTATMSLLEGHADVVMDDAGPAVIPSVAQIRRRFAARRSSGRGGPDRLLRRLLGLDAKLAQYTRGAAFVRGVTARVGHEGLNAAWESPEQLPRPEEVAAPDSWLLRVHGV